MYEYLDMEKVKKTPNNRLKEIGLGIYLGSVLVFLKMILTDGFSIALPFAFSIAILFTTLTAYPLFIRGTENRWTKDNDMAQFIHT